MSTKYILDPSGKIIKVINGRIETENLKPVKRNPLDLDTNNKNYLDTVNKNQGVETNKLLGTGDINSEGLGIGFGEEPDEVEYSYVIGETSKDQSFGFIDNQNQRNNENVDLLSTYLPFNSFASLQEGSNKPKVFADEFEILTGFRNREDEIESSFENAIFMFTYIAESIARIAAVEAIILVNKGINFSKGNQTDVAERYTLRLGKYDFTEFDIFTKYIYNVLNYPHESSSVAERLGAYFLGMSAWLSPDSIIDVENILKESKTLSKYTNEIDSFTHILDKKIFPTGEVILPAIIGSVEVLLAALNTTSLNRSRLLIRKFYREKHWHNKTLYRAKSRTNEDFFTDLNYYYFKFYIERVHVGLNLLKKYFYDDSYLKIRSKDSPLNRVSAARPPGVLRQTTSISSLPQAFHMNAGFYRSLVLNKKNSINIDNETMKKFKVDLKDNNKRRLSSDDVKKIENELEAEYMPFYFHDLRTNEIISFHAFIESIGDSFSPEYNSASGFGRIDDVKSYVKTTRNINLSFIVAATSQSDHDLMWYQINKIVAMCYPQWSDALGASTYNSETKKSEPASFKYPFTQVPTASPLIRLRVGDVIKSNYSRTNLSRLHGVGDVSNDYTETIQDLQTKIDNLIISYGKSGNDNENIEYKKVSKKVDAIKKQKENLEKINKIGNVNLLGEKSNGESYILRPGLYRLASGSIFENLGFGLTEGSRKSIKIDHEVAVSLKKEDLENKDYLNVTFGNIDLIVDKNQIITINKNKISDSEIKDAAFKDMTADAIVKPESGDDNDVLNNPITKSYESGMSRGLAGFITSLDVGYNESTWETSRIGSKAPMLVKINIAFSPIHDIPPGLDHKGMLRAPVYNVGRINNEFFGDPHDGDEGHGKGRASALAKYFGLHNKNNE